MDRERERQEAENAWLNSAVDMREFVCMAPRILETRFAS
jgi:hypothetical protein